MKTTKIVSLLIICLSTLSYGYQEVYDYHNIRQKAMGGTTVATFGRITDFYQNPAILALDKNVKLGFPKFGYGVNKDFFNDLQRINDVANGTNETEQINMLKDLVPLKTNFSLDFLPLVAFTGSRFGAISYAKGVFTGNLKRKTSPTLYLEGSFDTNLQIGYGHTFNYNNRNIHLGIAPRFTRKFIPYDQQTGNETYTLTQSDLIKITNGITELDPNLYELSGIGIDAGGLYSYELKSGAKGNVGFSIKNLLSFMSGNKDIVENGLLVNKKVNHNDSLVLSIGNSIEVNLPIITKVQLATDYNVIAPTQSFVKRIHIGAEKNILKFLDLRGGINQGFIVGGFGINLFLLQLDYAYFTEEFSGYIGKNTVETHNLQFSLLF